MCCSLAANTPQVFLCMQALLWCAGQDPLSSLSTRQELEEAWEHNEAQGVQVTILRVLW